MAPKRKSKNSPKDVRICKNMKMEESSSWIDEDDKIEKHSAGKNNNDKFYDKKLCPNLKVESVSPELLDENQMTNKAEFPNLQLNQLLEKRTKLNSLGSISWKTYLFPSILNLTSIFKKKQYFGLDLIDEETERTLWTHKPSVWQSLFQSVLEYAKTGQIEAISDMFNGILSCAVRAVPNGPNETKTFTSVKGQTIQHWIMLVPMPADIDSSEYIPKFICNFQTLSNKQYIRSAYKSGVNGITQHPGLCNQISEEGIYWNVLNNAAQKDIIYKSNNCLSEVLQDHTIKEVVSLMFGVTKDPNNWSNAIKGYAYGN